MSERTPSRIGPVLRTIAWALFFAFVFGFLLGTWIRSQLDKPVRYIGDGNRPALLLASAPGDIRHAQTCIFVACQHEEEI